MFAHTFIHVRTLFHTFMLCVLTPAGTHDCTHVHTTRAYTCLYTHLDTFALTCLCTFPLRPDLT